VTLRQRIMLVLLLIGMQGLVAIPALAQNRGAITIRYSGLSPFIALIAGILILIIPRLLNFIVAIYLIIVGLIGIFGL
jgi:hypothetical protein